jgi:hypothetical protein
MKIVVDPICCFAEMGNTISKMSAEGYKNIMLLQADGGMDSGIHYKQRIDKALSVAFQNGVQLFGGVFPEIFDRDSIMDQGCFLAGIHSDVHIIILENLSTDDIVPQIEKGLAPIAAELERSHFKTLFVFGDGFGGNNLHLINGIKQIVRKYPLRVIGGMTGRKMIKVSSPTVFTPQGIIQNGAVLVFTKVVSSLGVRHGWEPFEGSKIEITQTNGCFVERLNGMLAFDR